MPMNACGDPLIAISHDDGDSWTYERVSEARARGWFPHDGTTGYVEPANGGLPTDPHQPFKNLYGEAGMSALYSQQLQIAPDGTLYFAWVDARDDLPYLTTSTDGARTWSPRVKLAPAGVKLASEAAIAVDDKRPGHVAVAWYGSTDRTAYDGYLTEAWRANSAGPLLRTMRASPAKPLMPNGLSEPTEYVGVDIGPDGTPWASFSRDTCTIDQANPAPQCDGLFEYDGPRFTGVVTHLSRPHR
jgi:hypothetical protein